MVIGRKGAGTNLDAAWDAFGCDSGAETVPASFIDLFLNDINDLYEGSGKAGKARRGESRQLFAVSHKC